MAVKRSPKQRGEVAEFVRQLFEASGATTWAEFAQTAGVHPVSISAWQTGTIVPDGYNLLRLIRAAGGVPTSAAAEATIAAVLERLAEHSERLDERLAELERLQAEPEQREPDAEA